jgi:uncharacterized protein (UPF0305 family)
MTTYEEAFRLFAAGNDTALIREARRKRRNATLRRLRDAKRQRQKDEQRETNACSLQCLIEAFIEMRPYLPEPAVE